MRAPRSSNHRPRGANAVEAAVVMPVALMLIIGMCVIGLGIYRYQQVVSLAREGARYASVRGTQYAADTGNPAATQTDVSNAVAAMAVGLDTTNLSCQVSWNSSNSPTSYNPNSIPPGEPLDNTVSVTVSYQWTPELYLVGPFNLTSTSVMPMSY